MAKTPSIDARFKQLADQLAKLSEASAGLVRPQHLNKLGLKADQLERAMNALGEEIASYAGEPEPAAKRSVL